MEEDILECEESLPLPVEEAITLEAVCRLPSGQSAHDVPRKQSVPINSTPSNGRNELHGFLYAQGLGDWVTVRKVTPCTHRSRRIPGAF